MHTIFEKHPDWIKRAHERELTVNVWVVNDPGSMNWFLEQGVKYITTDEPELLLKQINKELK